MIRGIILYAVPEAYYGGDSNSYFTFARELWSGAGWNLAEKRRWLYPLFLALLPPLPGNVPQAVAWIQHFTGLISVLAVGWIVCHTTRWPIGWTPVVTLLWALWPRLLAYEHEILADCFLTVTFLAALACMYPVESFGRSRRLFCFWLVVALMASSKPHARPLWAGLAALAVVLAGAPSRWSRSALVAAGISAILMVTSGSAKQGSWLLLSSTLPLVPLEGEAWPEHRAALAPSIQEARALGLDYPWKQGHYKKALGDRDPSSAMGPEWVRLLRDRARAARAMRDLALEGILSHPVTFARFWWKKVAMSGSGAVSMSCFDPRTFWSDQAEKNRNRWETRPKELELLYGLERAAWPDFAARRQARPAFTGVADRILQILLNCRVSREITVSDNSPSLLAITPMGLLVLGGLALCGLPSWFRKRLPLWLPALCYLALVYAVGDTVCRYLLPVDALFLTLAAIALETVGSAIATLLSRRSSPSVHQAQEK